MSADYYFFAPTGGRYQTVFRGTLPRRYSIRRSQRGNNSATPYTFSLPLRLRPFHLIIVRGNCEAVCGKGLKGKTRCFPLIYLTFLSFRSII